MQTADLDTLRARATEVAGLMKTLSHPNRLLIACELMNGERAVSEIEENTGVRQPVLSRELARLRDENLVATRRASKVVFYSLSSERLLDLMTALCQSWGGKPMATQLPTEEKQATFPIIEGRKGTRVRINANPYRKD
jgi:DNA-binding transcriptional ArsR family regulator